MPARELNLVTYNLVATCICIIISIASVSMPTRSPHRALFYPEILDNIFDNLLLSNNTSPRANRRAHIPAVDLSRAARVCRAFSEPALRVLWRDLPNFLPLCWLLSSCHSVHTMGDDRYTDEYVGSLYVRLTPRGRKDAQALADVCFPSDSA